MSQRDLREVWLCPCDFPAPVGVLSTGVSRAAMKNAEQRHLRHLRRWAAKFGLSIEIVRTRERGRLGFYLRGEQDRVIADGENGQTLDEIESELLQREKKKLTRKSRE